MRSQNVYKIKCQNGDQLERNAKMPQEIKVPSLTIQIPEGFEILPTEEVDDLRSRADMRCWWDMKEVTTRYHRSKPWILEVLYNRKFKPLLENKCVFYGGKNKRRMYLFEPVRFSKFMRDYFPEITKELGKGIDNVKKERIK